MKKFTRAMVLDFETAWSRGDYSLTNMTTEEYIRDPRFKAWGASYKYVGGTWAKWVSRADLQEFFDAVDWTSTAVLAHNAMFDAAILAWRFGHHPAFIFDTLSMARALRGVEAGNSLMRLADSMGLPPKGKALHSTDGIMDVLPPHVEAELADYCNHDVYLCEKVFEALSLGFPASEMHLIDITLRAYTQPILELDGPLLEVALEEELARRSELLSSIGVEEASLASNPMFADVLRGLGVEPPMKISKTTGKETFAFAKTDAAFQAMLTGEREDISTLCEARLSVKSTQLRTRAQRFLDISKRGPLPVPLSFYGAHTGRWSATGGEQLNLQNLKRGSALRNAIMAPAGYSFVVGDLAQIEPRVLAWLAGFDAMLDIFRSGEDIYAVFGAQMFGVPGLNKEDHPVLRQSAKSATLGAGYMLGGVAFAAQLLTGFLGAPPLRYDAAMAKQLGVRTRDFGKLFNNAKLYAKVMSIPHTCTESELIVHYLASKAIIDKYRAASDPIVALWSLCGDLIVRSIVGGETVVHKCLTFRKGEVLLPNGMSLKYPDIEVSEDDEGRVQYRYGPRHKKLYAGSLVENLTQALARIVMSDGMRRIDRRCHIVSTSHDEIITVVPTDKAEAAAAWIRAQMIADPPFMPGIPLDVETGIGVRYGEAK